MNELFGDWQAEGTTSVLHEKKGGYANNKASMQGLAAKAQALGVQILEGVCVTGFERDSAGAVTSVVTDQGTIGCGYLIVGAGPWIKSIWEMLELPKSIDVKGPEVPAGGNPRRGSEPATDPERRSCAGDTCGQ
jgi:glycine/D-amino acid oxidase-like deaminating enzyme